MTLAATTLEGKVVIHLDEAGERGVTLQWIRPADDLAADRHVVEVQGWGFGRIPRPPPTVLVRAKNGAEAVRRAAGAVLLVYEEDSDAPPFAPGARSTSREVLLKTDDPGLEIDVKAPRAKRKTAVVTS